MDHAAYLILGTGPSGIASVEAIRSVDPRAPIRMVSPDPRSALSPVLLTYWMAGRCSSPDLQFRPAEWMNQFGVSLLSGARAVAIDGSAKRVEISGGRTLSYDRLLIATGALPILLPLPGHQTDGVAVLRTLRDAESILKGGPPVQRVVIIGGGFIGLKLAFHLNLRGVGVSLLEKEMKLAPRMLDPISSQWILKTLRSHGITVDTGVEVDEILSHHQRVRGVRLKSGEMVPCERVIQAVGVRPNIGFLKGSGITVEGGVLVNAHMETNLPFIYAAGDVAMTLDSITGERIHNATWPAATRQGKIAGANMAGRHERLVHNFPLNALHLFDLHVAAAGYPGHAEPAEGERFLIDQTQGYRKAVLKQGKITGFLLVGNVRDAGRLLVRMKREDLLSTDEQDRLWLGHETNLPAGLRFRHAFIG